MGAARRKEAFREREVNTLAQSGTACPYQIPDGAILQGYGTIVEGNTTMEKRARRKVISRAMILSLIDVAKEKGANERVKSYWNTYHCQNRILVSEGTAYARYCKNRCCTVCVANRKADIINRYFPVMKEWEDLYFVTLTVKSQPMYNLEKWVDGMFRAFERVKDRAKKRHSRGKAAKFRGIRSLECNFNPRAKTYNPHYHIIIEGREVAENLINDWLELWTTKETHWKAQHIRPVENLQHTLIETIKYGSKIFTETDLRCKGKEKVPRMLYVNALDNIFAAMQSRKIFSSFGFTLPRQERQPISIYAPNVEEFFFPHDGTDWLNPSSGELLTGFRPNAKLEYLLEQSIDTDLC